MNVESKLAKILDREPGTLVVKAGDRDTVLSEISARAARYKKIDTEVYNELMTLRKQVKDTFDKGLTPGHEILEQLYFLDPATRELVERMSKSYNRVVTPNDFKAIASLMSKHLSEQVPILNDFTKFFGRLAEDFLIHSKPDTAAMSWTTVMKGKILGDYKKGFILPDRISEFFGMKAGEPVSEKVLRSLSFYHPNSGLADIYNGVKAPEYRKTGAKFLGLELTLPIPSWAKKALLTEKKIIPEIEILKANKLPKSWTNIPWINFDGKTIEQNFTQSWEEKLVYKNKAGEWITNFIQVSQKTESSFADQLLNKTGKINDIADATKARTAFAVNGNHSNDATLVKQFHIWGSRNGVPTSTIHDAFFTNIGDMLESKRALRQIYGDAMKRNVIKLTLDEMRARGLPKAIYDQYMNEAIEKGLIPVVGRSRIGGRVLTDEDILLREDVIGDLDEAFNKRHGFYGVGP
jgi:hypothetical protein